MNFPTISTPQETCPACPTRDGTRTCTQGRGGLMPRLSRRIPYPSRHSYERGYTESHFRDYGRTFLCRRSPSSCCQAPVVLHCSVVYQPAGQPQRVIPRQIPPAHRACNTDIRETTRPAPLRSGSRVQDYAHMVWVDDGGIMGCCVVLELVDTRRV